MNPGLTGRQDLASWPDAVRNGGLPEPSRADRWQLLRAGVVNLWEFDVAEYWLAGGRAQFVGQNQSGKSTLMALTSLILLAGDLDRELVDTFGQQHKAFRYYVEPSGDPQDRRETGPATSRGWAWLEFARYAEGQPQYFTCLLFAQARRGAAGLEPTWAVCAGTARVRAGLELHQAAAVRPPAALAAVPGFRAAASGADYRSWVARELFGFTGPDRLDAIVRMLKVLRTPHLGQRLDPGFFTAQMRTALPAVEPAQIAGLAEGWDALDALARDRDHARTARDAVASYLSQAWYPWADATLRWRADDLLTSVQQLDDAATAAEDTAAAVAAARDQVAETAGQLETARETRDRVEQGYEDLLTSPAYRDTADTATRVDQLQQTAARSRQSAADTATEARAAQAALDRRAAEQKTVTEAAARAADRVATAVRAVAAAAARAGLPAEVADWAARGDLDRLDAALRQQRQQVAGARPLLAAAALARQQEEAAARWAVQATSERSRWVTRADQAAQGVDAALQALSDELEGWAAALGDDAPPSAQRAGWVTAVSEQATQPEPQPVLTGLLRESWLAPLTAELRERAAVLEHDAGGRQRQAHERDDQAARQLLEAEPQPAPASRWIRRERPAAGPDGTPLWRLLEPRDGVPPEVLAHIEAALDAAGLLEAWVTPDGAWLPGRDGQDVVLTAATGWPDTTAAFSTLASVLQPAADAGPLASRVGGLLHAVGYLAEEHRAPLSYAYGVTADGRWHTPYTAGQAGVPEHGAELIGVASRRAARDRRAQFLRDEAAALREEATGLRHAAAGRRERLAALDGAAARAPGDSGVVRAVLAAHAAGDGLRRAEAVRDRAEEDLARARAAAQDAHTTLGRAGLFTAPASSGPSTGAGVPAAALDERADALQGAAAAVAELTLARAGQDAAGQAEDRARVLFAEMAQQAAAAGERATRALRHADRDQDVADNAEEALDESDRDLRQAAREQRRRRDELAAAVDGLQAEHGRRLAEAAAAEVRGSTAAGQREQAARARATALAAWWIPVDAGLAGARGLPTAAGRTLAHATAQAQAARQQLAPPGWPGPDEPALRVSLAARAWAMVVGRPLAELRTVLEASGGRGVVLHDPAGPGQLPAVAILVDGAGLASEPARAVAQLDQQIATLAERHDRTMHQVLADLLSSTFVEHLQDRQAAVTELISGVNQVLAQHPTGASATTLRLRRQAAPGHETAFAVLTALEPAPGGPPAADGTAAAQVRTFLEQQIRAAQDQGRAGTADWREHLSVLLDYRRWFDVVTDYRVGEGTWRPFTEEVHAKDSGGGKAVTLLQPMLAALAALYAESASAPRPLWLDEAFTGVDDANRATMLGLLVTFDLDFLLAGPATLVTTAQVPSAAIWFISRAPAPDPGVDLSLMLWSGDEPADQNSAGQDGAGQNRRSESSSVPRIAS